MANINNNPGNNEYFVKYVRSENTPKQPEINKIDPGKIKNIFDGDSQSGAIDKLPGKIKSIFDGKNQPDLPNFHIDPSILQDPGFNIDLPGFNPDDIDPGFHPKFPGAPEGKEPQGPGIHTMAYPSDDGGVQISPNPKEPGNIDKEPQSPKGPTMRTMAYPSDDGGVQISPNPKQPGKPDKLPPNPQQPGGPTMHTMAFPSDDGGFEIQIEK